MLFPVFYKICALHPVKSNKVLLIETHDETLNGSFRMVCAWLKQKRPDVKIHVVYTRADSVNQFVYLLNCLKLIYELSNSKAVFLSEACNILGAVNKRKETRVIQLWHGCGAFKKFGYSTAELLWGATREELEEYPNYENMDIVTVSSPEVIWAYEEAMGIEREKILPIGISRTDLFFQKDFLNKCKTNFYKQFAGTENKKIILYAPTFRGNMDDIKTCEEFPYEDFCRKFGKATILLVKHHPFVKSRPELPEICNGIVFDVTETMKIEELLCISDLCISDYSSLIFEYSLMERPMIFFAPEKNEYDDWRGFYYPYEEMTPGPICEDADTLLQAIENNLQHFDAERIRQFRNKFMSACDGHSTKRIMELAFAEDNI